MRYYLGGVALLALFACAHIEPAQAQQSTVVTTCGTQNIPGAQGTSGTYIDHTGNLCTNASGGGGGGGAITAASGAYASGSISSGAIASGAMVDLGSQADSACATDNGTCSAIALIKRGNQNATTLNTTASGAIPAGTNAIGTLTGSTAYGLQSAASTNATSVKGSAGVLKAMNLINTTTTIYYLRMYNLASAPTCSSATGFVRTWPVPPAASAGLAGGIAADLGAGGTTFSTGIAFCLTGGPSSTDNTNAATGVFVNLDYQ